MVAKVITVDAILFDMDGTLIDSTPGVMSAWKTFAQEYSFDAEQVAHASHGRRLHDTLKEWCHIDNEERLQAEVQRFEEQVIEVGPSILPGTLALLDQLTHPGTNGWTIVTSATSAYTAQALERCGIPIPLAGYVTSDDVSRGKPHPDPYLMGAKRCAVDASKCLIVEDAPSGLKAGHAAGAQTLAVCTSHSRQAIIESHADPDFIVDDLTKVSLRRIHGRIEVTIDDSTH